MSSSAQTDGPDMSSVEAAATEGVEKHSHPTPTDVTGATAEVARTFLDAIGFRDDDRVTICHRATEHEPILWSHVTTVEAPDVVAAHARGDVWVSTCPLRAGRIDGRGKASDVVGIRSLFCDLDDEKMRGGRTDVEAVAGDLAAALNRQPAAIVDTGNGLHLWFALDPEDDLDFEPDSERSREVASLVKRFGALVQRIAEAHGGSADSVFDLARIMRVPGTHNTKGATA